MSRLRQGFGGQGPDIEGFGGQGHHVDGSGGLAPARGRALVDAFAGRRVLVVGDVMLDHFLFGRVQRLSPEAPVPIVEYARDEFRPGGAANVAMNLAALGATVHLVSVVGDDEAAGQLRAGLVRGGVSGDHLITDTTRPTTRKLRIVTQRQQQVARVDFESDVDVPDDVAAALGARIAATAADADVILISDYLKGVITAGVMAHVLDAARSGGLAVLVDPKIPHLDLYRGVTLVTPNQLEAETATHARIRSDADARDVARRLRTGLQCASVVVTRGEHGMWVLDGSVEPAVETNFAATALEVSDVTGAGDTVIATLALGLASGATLLEAAQLATAAAGVAVSRFGAVAVTRDELLARLG